MNGHREHEDTEKTIGHLRVSEPPWRASLSLADRVDFHHGLLEHSEEQTTRVESAGTDRPLRRAERRAATLTDVLATKELLDLAEYLAVDLFGKRRVEGESMTGPVFEHVKTEGFEQVTATLPDVAALEFRDQALQNGVSSERRSLRNDIEVDIYLVPGSNES